MKKLRIIIILYFVLLGALAASAKGSVKITGTVTDENNEPMEFVTVKIGKAIGTTTGADGRYALTSPETDTLRITFT